jgi:hypothetical protein
METFLGADGIIYAVLKRYEPDIGEVVQRVLPLDAIPSDEEGAEEMYDNYEDGWLEEAYDDAQNGGGDVDEPLYYVDEVFPEDEDDF